MARRAYPITTMAVVAAILAVSAVVMAGWVTEFAGAKDTYTVDIEVDAGGVERPIPTEMFGVNLASGSTYSTQTGEDEGGGIWNAPPGSDCLFPSTTGVTLCENSLTEMFDLTAGTGMLADLGPGSLRYPDGDHAQDYDPSHAGLPVWLDLDADRDIDYKNCNREHCARSTLYGGYPQRRHPFGFGEFMALSEKLGAVPSIVLPFPTGGGDTGTNFLGDNGYNETEFAELVFAYLDFLYGNPDIDTEPPDITRPANIRALNGHPDAYGAVRFELGNEPWEVYGGNAVTPFAEDVIFMAETVYNVFYAMTDRLVDEPPFELGFDIWEAPGGGTTEGAFNTYLDAHAVAAFNLIDAAITPGSLLDEEEFPDFFITHIYRPGCDNTVQCSTAGGVMILDPSCPNDDAFVEGLVRSSVAAADTIRSRFEHVIEYVLDVGGTTPTYSWASGKPIAVTEWGNQIQPSFWETIITDGDDCLTNRGDAVSCSECETDYAPVTFGVALGQANHLIEMLRMDTGTTNRISMVHYFNLITWSLCRECNTGVDGGAWGAMRRFADGTDHPVDPAIPEFVQFADCGDTIDMIVNDPDPAFIQRPMYDVLRIFNTYLAGRISVPLEITLSDGLTPDLSAAQCWIPNPYLAMGEPYPLVHAVAARDESDLRAFTVVVVNTSDQTVTAMLTSTAMTSATSNTFSSASLLDHNEDVVAFGDEDVKWDPTAIVAETNFSDQTHWACPRWGYNELTVGLEPYSITIIEVETREDIYLANGSRNGGRIGFAFATLPVLVFLLAIKRRRSAHGSTDW